MTPSSIRQGDPECVDLIEVDSALTRPKAIVAALLAAGHAAIARVADGAVWEEESDIVIEPTIQAHAERMALIWQRTAQHLQSQQATKASRLLRRIPAAPERSAPYESRIDRSDR